MNMDTQKTADTRRRTPTTAATGIATVGISGEPLAGLSVPVDSSSIDTLGEKEGGEKGGRE